MQIDEWVTTWLGDRGFAGALIGGAIGAFGSVLGVWLGFYAQSKAEQKKTLLREKMLLTALHQKVDYIWGAYMTTYGDSIEKLEKSSFRIYFADTEEHLFTWASLAEISEIQNPMVRARIITVSATGRALIQALRHNNRLLDERRELNRSLKDASVTDKLRGAMNGDIDLVKYAPVLKKCHSDLVKEVGNLLEELNQYSLSSEKNRGRFPKFIRRILGKDRV